MTRGQLPLTEFSYHSATVDLQKSDRSLSRFGLWLWVLQGQKWQESTIRHHISGRHRWRHRPHTDETLAEMRKVKRWGCGKSQSLPVDTGYVSTSYMDSIHISSYIYILYTWCLYMSKKRMDRDNNGPQAAACAVTRASQLFKFQAARFAQAL